MINEVKEISKNYILDKLFIFTVFCLIFMGKPSAIGLFLGVCIVLVIFRSAIKIADMEDSERYKQAKWVDENIKSGKWTCTWEKQD